MTATIERTLTSSVNEVNEMIRRGELAEGINRFYADDVLMIESSSEQTRGRSENYERERLFASGLTRWDATLNTCLVDEERGVAFNHWTIHFDHTQFGSGVLEQVAVQQWLDGRIVREAFYKV